MSSSYIYLCVWVCVSLAPFTWIDHYFFFFLLVRFFMLFFTGSVDLTKSIFDRKHSGLHVPLFFIYVSLRLSRALLTFCHLGCWSSKLEGPKCYRSHIPCRYGRKNHSWPRWTHVEFWMDFFMQLYLQLSINNSELVTLRSLPNIYGIPVTLYRSIFRPISLREFQNFRCRIGHCENERFIDYMSLIFNTIN